MVHSGFRRFGHFSYINQFSNKWHRLASTASDRKGAQIQHIFMIQTKKSFQNIKVNLNSRIRTTLKSPLVICQALETTVSVRGCWGQPMLLFWKLVDETQMPWPQECTDTFKQNLTCIILSVRVHSKETFQCETPCTMIIVELSKDKCKFYKFSYFS